MLLDLRRRVFRHTQRLSLEFHEKYTSGRIISRQTSDLDALRELLDGGVTTLASGVLVMVFTAVSLVLLDWRSGLVLLIAVVPGIVLTRWFQVPLAGPVPQSADGGGPADRAVRRDHDRHPRGAGVPPGAAVRGVYGELAEDYRDANATVDPAQRRLRHRPDPDRQRHGRGRAAGRRPAGAGRRHRGRGAGRRRAVRAALLQPARSRSACSTTRSSRRRRPWRRSRGAARRGAHRARAREQPQRLADARGDVRFDDVEFGYGDGPDGPPARRPAHPGRPDRRPRRRDRRRQVDDREAARPVLRRP